MFVPEGKIHKTRHLPRTKVIPSEREREIVFNFRICVILIICACAREREKARANERKTEIPFSSRQKISILDATLKKKKQHEICVWSMRICVCTAIY